MSDLDMSPGARRAVAVLFVLVLALFGANLLFTAREVNAVRHATATVTQLCEAGNMARAQQAGLWDYLIHLSPPPKTTQGRLVLAKFERHLHAVFAPRNCQAPLTTRRNP